MGYFLFWLVSIVFSFVFRFGDCVGFVWFGFFCVIVLFLCEVVGLFGYFYLVSECFLFVWGFLLVLF